MARGFGRAPRWALVVLAFALAAIGAMVPVALHRQHQVQAAVTRGRVDTQAEATTAAAATSTPPSVAPKFTVKMSDLADGPVPATVGGQSFTTVDNGRNSSGMAVAGGHLVHGTATGSDAASYLLAPMPAAPTVIGAEVSFHSSGGSIALVSWQSEVTGRPGRGLTIPNGGVHFVATPTDWHLGVWDGGAKKETILWQGTFDAPLDTTGKTTYRFQILRNGDDVWVETPGGMGGPFGSPKVADWSGPWACWELYENTAGEAPAAFDSIWAG